MQVCTSLQTDNQTSTPPLFFTGRMPFLPPNQQCQSTEGIYSDLPAVDILNHIHKAAATMWRLATSFVATCLFCWFSCAVYGAVLVACSLAYIFPAPPSSQQNENCIPIKDDAVAEN